MCHPSVVAWGRSVLTADVVAGRRVLEVGARDVNGSLRPHVEALGPACYLGVDMEPGEGVDEICYAESLEGRFEAGAFDIVLSTEMLEHVRNWRTAIRNMKAVLAPGGLLLLTTRSEGFPLHEHPADYWRFSAQDIDTIFIEFWPRKTQEDPEAPGVLFWGRKPDDTVPPADLDMIPVYSMQAGRRVP